ncbi:pilus assembly protein [Rhizobium wenxiniae]|uniref:TadE/TadG family type IV pilus assembly protein n=1 Tax=Rhizobium wenxiniae TaxID=1737357 RepID=UPI001C6F14EE|nr:TadE/TadG family type IV pilus assembly protein [Rhizobium wenxiniae]MBW9086704.1 pilus assembly protein [Rhizobium wenxiniae]
MAILKRFADDRGGNFGIMTALIMVPLLLAGGSVLDVSTAYTQRTNMQGIADAAALAGGAVYDGTNSAAAIAKAEAFLKGYKAKLPTGATYSVTMTGQNVNVSIEGKSANSVMQLAGISNIDVGVTSQAIAPLKPKTINFTPTQAQGWYWKKVTIRVVRPNSTKEETIGTVTYQPVTRDDGGQGTMTVSPSGVLNLGKYTKLVLQMDIKNDSCPTGERLYLSGSNVYCYKTDLAQYAKYDLTLRTDNPDTSHYLFVEGKQLPKGVTSPLDDILICGKTSNHAWEDGGGFSRQDFFYTVATTCAPDGEFVRLTK